jgi:hypothetical protein
LLAMGFPRGGHKRKTIADVGERPARASRRRPVPSNSPG